MTAWMNVNSRESQEIQPNIGLASVAQSDTIVEASQGLYAHQEATVEEGQNAAPGANDRMASVGKHDARKQTSRSDVRTCTRTAGTPRMHKYFIYNISPESLERWRQCVSA